MGARARVCVCVNACRAEESGDERERTQVPQARCVLWRVFVCVWVWVWVGGCVCMDVFVCVCVCVCV